MQEDDTVQLYYSTENTREFKEVEEQNLEVGIELAPAVEHLIGSYPKWTKVEELPVDELEDRMKVKPCAISFLMLIFVCCRW